MTYESHNEIVSFVLMREQCPFGVVVDILKSWIRGFTLGDRSTLGSDDYNTWAACLPSPCHLESSRSLGVQSSQQAPISPLDSSQYELPARRCKLSSLNTNKHSVKSTKPGKCKLH